MKGTRKGKKKNDNGKWINWMIRQLTRLLPLLLGLVIGSTLWIGVTLHSSTTVKMMTSDSSSSSSLENVLRRHRAGSAGSGDHPNITSTTMILQPANRKESNNINNNNIDSDPSNYYSNLLQHNLWKDHPRLPQWIKDFMTWQTQQLQTLTIDNWETGGFKYLVLRCYRADERCGGVSDRLKPVPLMVLSAAKSNRLLFIDWDRPYPLEEFLVSPTTPGGFPWHVPNFLNDIMHNHPKQMVTRASTIIRYAQHSNSTLIHTHIHDTLGGATQYNEYFALPGETAENFTIDHFGNIFHDLFRVFFEPAPAVQTLMDAKLLLQSKEQQHKYLLIPGEYAVAHYRAEYGREVRRHPKLTEPGFMKKVAENAVRCASELLPNKPIYFASDNPIVMDIIRNYTIAHDNDNSPPIVMFERSEAKVLPLDYYNDSDDSVPILERTKPSDYYSTFVDLFVAGNGQCVAYGRGGFGRFASMLSFNASCSRKHVKNFFSEYCEGYGTFYQENPDKSKNQKK